MKKTANLNLASLRDLIKAADIYLTTNGEGINAEFLISDVKNYLKSFLSSFPEVYHTNIKFPVLFEDSELRKGDRVKIIGSPIFRDDTAMINYTDKEGVILQVLENGNYWVGVLPTSSNIPCIEIGPSAVKSLG